MISGSLIFSNDKSVGMKTFSHFMSLWSRIRLAGGSRRMGPRHRKSLRIGSDGPACRVGWVGSGRFRCSGPPDRVASDGPAGRVRWSRGWHRMGPRVASDGPADCRVGWAGSGRFRCSGPAHRVASDGPAGRVGWACGSRRMGPRVASDGPAVGIGWARGWHRIGQRFASDGSGPAGRVG